MKTLFFYALMLIVCVPTAAAEECSESGIPQAPGNVRGEIPIKTWYKEKLLTVSWDEAAGCGSDIAGYSYTWDTVANTEPDAAVETNETNTVSPELGKGRSHYFHIRSVDMQGKASSTVHLGPFYIDTALPCDINGDKKVAISDAILAVKISCGEDTGNANIQPGSGVEPGGIVGLTSAIFVLRKLAAHDPGDCLNAEEKELARLINEYRVQNGLTEIAVSKSLTSVAQWHTIDLSENKPNTGECGMHSWSDKGAWSSVCITLTQTDWSKMESKPREITNNVYTGNAYEIAYSATGQVVAATVMTNWKNSSHHNNVILQKDIWSVKVWSAMGVGIYGGYAVVWFGETTDPQGGVSACE